MGETKMALQTTNGVGLDAYRVEKTISFNVKVRLTALGLNQTALADYLGIKRSTISVKLNGKSVWTVPDLVNTANYLETTPEALMDDTLITQMGLDTGKAAGEPAAKKLPQLGLNQRHFD